MPIAIAQNHANEQHYEVPDEFYQMVLGPCLKYSCGLWIDKSSTLFDSEVAMLELYIARSGIVDGMNVLDVGCGWGSVTLYLAKRFPNSKIIAISNSHSQRAFIMGQAAARGFDDRVTVFTGDISTFELPIEYCNFFDRAISIEMFEHMKNYGLLMKKISHWIKPGGKLFVHIFTSRDVPSHFEHGWMADNFFTGGTLPSHHLLLYFQDDLRIESQWKVNGSHYQRTLEAWLKIMDSKKKEVLPLLASTYGEDQALKRFVDWRLFFVACAEFFGMRNGEEYLVSHYLFTKPMSGLINVVS
jgi:cyclopropane-fatty-acyl-phospholipid synthase